MVEDCASSLGGLNWAVNNAAGGAEAEPRLLTEISEEEWELWMAHSLRSVWLCMKHEIPLMIRSGGGAITNMGSMTGVTGAPNMAAYASAKGGVIALTKTAAAEYAPYGVRVNVVNPGMVRTPANEAFLQWAPDIARRGIAAHALERMAEPEEVAHAALFLCSSRAGFITGEMLAVDGGTQVRSTIYP